MSPNQPKTPVRTFRLADDLWIPIQEAAKEDGETASDFLRRAAVRELKARARRKR